MLQLNHLIKVAEWQLKPAISSVPLHSLSVKPQLSHSHSSRSIQGNENWHTLSFFLAWFCVQPTAESSGSCAGSIKGGICWGGGQPIEYPASSRGESSGGLFIFLFERTDACVLSQPRQEQIAFRFVQQRAYMLHLAIWEWLPKGLLHTSAVCVIL